MARKKGKGKTNKSNNTAPKKEIKVPAVSKEEELKEEGVENTPDSKDNAETEGSENVETENTSNDNEEGNENENGSEDNEEGSENEPEGNDDEGNENESEEAVDVEEVKPVTDSVVAGEFVEYVSTDNDELNTVVNSSLNTYRNHMDPANSPDSETSVASIRLLGSMIKSILDTPEDDDFTAAWDGLAEAIADAEDDSPLQATLLTRGAHADDGVPSVNDNIFQLLILLGMEEGNSINLEDVVKGLPEVARARLMNYYS